MSEARNEGRILIVEDDINVRTILKMQLERAHYTVRVAEDGETGLQMLADEIPDLVLLDVMMPGMDGWEVCRRIKGDMATVNLPVIMLTARSDQEDKLRGLTSGANDYLTKPYELDELLLRVRNMLLWSKMQRAANPLTGLPGNIAIENELRIRLEAKQDFVFIYLDIDHFKGFNDYYSFRRGDEAIRLTASIILSAVAIEGSETGFVGHVGGDDFVVIVDAQHADAVIAEVIREFDEKVPKLYERKDRERRYIETTDRQGNTVQYPLMTLTIAAVTNKGRTVNHVGEISQKVAELKSYGKKKPASVVVWERRAA
jgi:diguanylate cyclase (GGDEF)-like protein